MKILSKVTGKRTGGETTPYLVATPTKGGIKLNDPAIDALKVRLGDRISILKAEDEDGNAVLVMGVTQEGSKLGDSGAGLQFSDAAGWGNLGGYPEVNRYFTIDLENAEEADEETIKAGLASKGDVFYYIAFDHEDDKIVRTRKED